MAAVIASVMASNNAAKLAYKKAVKRTRDKENLATHPLWMQYFAQQLPEEGLSTPKMKETKSHKLERILQSSGERNFYARLSWEVFHRITSQSWFETFILLNILLIGIATGLDLESNDSDAGITAFVNAISIATTIVFTVEVGLKIIAEGYAPLQYFTDPDDGAFNTFDFLIVLLGYILMMTAGSGGGGGSAIGALRMLRLVKLFTFVKGVPLLRAIMAGLVKGMQSVTYIVILLILVMYLFAIMASMLFGDNDPARFGTVPMSMVTLFQVACLTSWTSVAYTNWYGCGEFLGDPYAAAAVSAGGPTSTIETNLGLFQGFKCNESYSTGKPVSVWLFFSIYVILAAWIVLSLFIGVISTGMFEAFAELKASIKDQRYRDRLAENAAFVAGENGNQKRKKISLAEKIDFVFQDNVEAEGGLQNGMQLALQDYCRGIKESVIFNNVIIFMIVLVGVLAGVETDQINRCYRASVRASDDGSNESSSDCDDQTLFVVTAYIAQAVFVFEAGVRILAEGSRPMQYFYDKRDGSWNTLDFFIVVAGFYEIFPVAQGKSPVPVVALRLLRLLRVFRVAKGAPRLRSIVDALISGLCSVGWVCILAIVFNYIMGCMFMLLFRKNDPFHFGSVSRAMFSILIVETLDSWVDLMYVNMYGCGAYPLGYPYLGSDSFGASQCNESLKGEGWGAALVFVLLVITGSFVIPTLMIGMVSVAFEEASRRAEAVEDMEEKIKIVSAEAIERLPLFFTPARIEMIRDLFDTMDVDGEMSLDVLEMSPFYAYAFKRTFDIDLDKDQTEALFYLMDMDGDTELGFAEFFLFISVMKKIEDKCKVDSKFAEDVFPDAFASDLFNTKQGCSAEAWKAAMVKLDKKELEGAWHHLIHHLSSTYEGMSLPVSVKALFESIDSDASGELDAEELAHSLRSQGIFVNERQVKMFTESMDNNKDGAVSLEELTSAAQREYDKLEKVKREATKADAQRLLKQYDTLVAEGGLVPDMQVQLMFDKAEDSKRSLGEVVNICADIVSTRLMLHSQPESVNVTNGALAWKTSAFGRVLKERMRSECQLFELSPNLVSASPR